MAIDMRVLQAVSQGDPGDRLEVKRAWLGEVHKLLEQAQRDADELRELRDQMARVDHLGSKVERQDRSPFDDVFGQGGSFDRVFGRRKR